MSWGVPLIVEKKFFVLQIYYITFAFAFQLKCVIMVMLKELTKMEFRIFTEKDKTFYKQIIVDAMKESDSDFVPPLSARSSTTQKNAYGRKLKRTRSFIILQRNAFSNNIGSF